MTPRRVTLARMFKEAGLRSPRTQLTKVKIEISVLGRRTEASGRQNACIIVRTQLGYLYLMPSYNNNKTILTLTSELSYYAAYSIWRELVPDVPRTRPCSGKFWKSTHQNLDLVEATVWTLTFSCKWGILCCRYAALWLYSLDKTGVNTPLLSLCFSACPGILDTWARCGDCAVTLRSLCCLLLPLVGFCGARIGSAPMFYLAHSPLRLPSQNLQNRKWARTCKI